ncbi:hypothetical protein J2789_004972 [Variovorax paradoxus]|uniref:hypothetical protein n=1 Tax=Variovorax TaxID=34072 RepID=UPI00119F56B2|nr:hypothetical protein [Variovorax paradoxus]MDR6522282.1 hypothetical protein [Variovorax paradoxus]
MFAQGAKRYGKRVAEQTRSSDRSPEQDIAPVVLIHAGSDAKFLTGYSLSSDGDLIVDAGR